MAQTPTLWNGGRLNNLPGMSRDNAPSKPVDPGLIARVSQNVRSWLGINTTKGGTELPFFPPGKPLEPVAPGAVGRRFDYPTNYNATIRPRTYEPIDFETLRALAEPGVGGWDLIRLAVETRKDQMSKLTYSILPRKPADAQVRPKSDERCRKVEEFLRRPDGTHSWADWVRMLVEEHLVIDAATIYKHPTITGDVAKLELIDGATIKPILGYDGRRPTSGPAYVQNLKGLPAVDYTTEEMIYAPRNPRVNKVYGYCYTPDHEVLTRRGWRAFTDVTLQDEIATRNQTTKAFEWQRPSRLVTMPHRGEVYRLHSRAVDLMVTPDHNVLLDSLPSAARGGRRRTRGHGGDVLVRAADVAFGHNPMNKIPMTSVWQGVEVSGRTFALPVVEETIEVRRVSYGIEQVYVRARSSGSERPITVSGDDYCALLGAYLAEGNIRSDGGLEINQRATSKGYGAYAALTARILGGPAQHNGKAFVLPRRGLTAHFAEFGLAHEKFIPDEVMQAPIRQLRLFWDHYVLGDGTFEPRPNASGRGSRAGESTERICTTSPAIAGQLMEIAQKLGWSASVRRRPGGPQTILKQPESIVRDSYVVSVRHSKAMGFSIASGWYEGDVHCVTVPNGVIYVRRNGKPAWCGNSPVEQVLVTINIGLRRQVSQLGYFTEGNVPDAVAAVPPDWPIQRIQEFQDYWDTIVNDAVRRRKMKFIPGGVQLQHTRNDQALVDQFDEWLARIVQYCFSLPPTPLVRAVNRATAESAYDQSIDEGLSPLMMWIKNLMDDIIVRWFRFADLEMVWDDAKKVDPAEKEQRDMPLIQQGIISRDDLRADRGMEPLGVPPIVQGVGPLGFMSVKAMIKAIENGWDLTGMPQPGMPGAGMAGMPATESMDPSLIGSGQPGDPLNGLPPEILEALGVDPQQAGGAQPNPINTASAQPPDDELGDPEDATPSEEPPPTSGKVVPIHKHPAIQAALKAGEAHARKLAARMGAAGG